MKRIIVILMAVALMLAACGGGDKATPTAVPVATTAPASAEVPATEVPVAGSAQEALQQVLDVVAHDIYYGETNDNIQNPPEWSVSAGGEVTLNFTNAGVLNHDFAIAKLDAELPVPFMAENDDLLYFDIGELPGGQSQTVTFTAPTEPGIYTVICTVLGHYPNMQARLVVK